MASTVEGLLNLQLGERAVVQATVDKAELERQLNLIYAALKQINEQLQRLVTLNALTP